MLVHSQKLGGSDHSAQLLSHALILYCWLVTQHSTLQLRRQELKWLTVNQVMPALIA